MVKILTPRNISIELRSRIAKCYIWSTLLYGAETWTLTKVTSDKLEAFETWLYRRMLRISLRSRIAKCYIWSTLLYGAETWTLTKVTSDKLEKNRDCKNCICEYGKDSNTKKHQH